MHTWPTQAPISGLLSPILLQFLYNSIEYLMLAQSCKFGVNCCFIGLTHPAACTRARVPLIFGHVHRPPSPWPNLLKKGSNRLGLSWGFRRYIWNFVGDPYQKTRIPPGGPTTPLPPRIGPIHIPIESFWWGDSEYLILIETCTCRPKVTQIPAFCYEAHKLWMETKSRYKSPFRKSWATPKNCFGTVLR